VDVLSKTLPALYIIDMFLSTYHHVDPVYYESTDVSMHEGMKIYEVLIMHLLINRSGSSLN